MIKYWQILYRRRHIILALTKQDIVVRYNRSMLGILWALISPLMLAVIVGFVYGKLFNTDFKSFFPYFFSGLITWIFVSGCANAGTTAFLIAEGYIKQINLDVEIFPLRVALSTFFHYLMAIFAYYVVALFCFPEIFTRNIWLILPCMLLLLWISSSITVIAAFLNTYFRDYTHLQSIVLQIVFYVTPIIYQPSMLADRGASYIFEYNPFYYMINIMRAPLLGQPVSWDVFGITVGVGCLLHLAIVLLYRYRKKQIVFQF